MNELLISELKKRYQLELTPVESCVVLLLGLALGGPVGKTWMETIFLSSGAFLKETELEIPKKTLQSALDVLESRKVINKARGRSGIVYSLSSQYSLGFAVLREVAHTPDALVLIERIFREKRVSHEMGFGYYDHSRSSYKERMRKGVSFLLGDMEMYEKALVCEENERWMLGEWGNEWNYLLGAEGDFPEDLPLTMRKDALTWKLVTSFCDVTALSPGWHDAICGLLKNKENWSDTDALLLSMIAIWGVWTGDEDISEPLNSLKLSLRVTKMVQACRAVHDGNQEEALKKMDVFCRNSLMKNLYGKDRLSVVPSVLTCCLLGALDKNSDNGFSKHYSFLFDNELYWRNRLACDCVGVLNKHRWIEGMELSSTKGGNNLSQSWDAFFLTACLPLIPTSVKSRKKWVSECMVELARFEENGFHWAAFQMATILVHCKLNSYDLQSLQSILNQYSGKWQEFFSEKKPQEHWQQALTFLDMEFPREKVEMKKPQEEKVKDLLVWVLEVEPIDAWLNVESISPKLRKKRPNNTWTAGRAVSLKKLVQGHYSEVMDEFDRNALNAISVQCSWYGDEHYFVNTERLSFFIGHPRLEVVSKSGAEPCHLEKASFPIEVREDADGGVTVSSSINLDKMIGIYHFLLRKEEDGVYRMFMITKSVRSLIDALSQFGNKGALTFPSAGKEMLKGILGRASDEFTLIGNTNVAGSEEVEELQGAIHLRMQMEWQNGELKMDLRNMPLEGMSCVLLPGKGLEKSIIRDSGRTVLLKRHIVREKNAYKAVLAACPSIAEWNVEYCSWMVNDLESVLTVLDELKQAGEAGLVQMEWKKGSSLSVKGMKDGLTLSLKSDGTMEQWLSIGGDLCIDDKSVCSLMELLNHLPSRIGSYVPLDGDLYVKLTSSLIQQLDLIRQAASVHQGKLGLNPAAVPALANRTWGEGALAWPKKITEAISRFQKNCEKTPELPEGLLCDLRSYQKEGFYWLSRLTSCGFGCCLADDMGLGKTVQLLTLLLSRSEEGPSLVVAPASLCSHWCEESSRFTPRLNMIDVHDGDDSAFSNLGKGDVVVCSYGLLVSRQKTIDKVSWNCLILDEAQNIKNRASRRARCTKSVHADIRVASSGTPVENNLDELWSLFDFLNPGLLGPHDTFMQRFCPDGMINSNLRKLVSPLMLRRMKTEVLDELPSKTEIVHTLDLSAQERALYEKIRREAVSALEDEENRIAVLAYLTKLRRMCCHPSLVEPGLQLSGTKLETATELIRELHEGKHRGLIFSQFVDVLKLVAKKLDKEGISYQYLDGSTSMVQRQKAVADFQNGAGDFFLISLKAGGTGLNLTAAHYVILMDPWWNPAVDDQAADRTYRIGQKKPVTVYRLVCKDTVEERVLELHARKKALAEDLMKDSASSSSISLDEMMALLG